MTVPAIRVEGLGKRYRIGQPERYKTIRDSLSDTLSAPKRWLAERKNLRGSGNGQSDHFWALKDVFFQVEPGEVVGIIGRNGAGKSTLLKILSRVTEPTEGRVEVNGRVGSLLEVGTGFHPELTGRENIFMNGAILGMSRCEIRRKFDEIVSFAEIGQFLDTPVKRYSSGMYVRLAFAVAVHLEPETLVVDEVLAVGDASFQRKCFDKIRQVANGGRTILFVSHNLSALRQICTKGMALDQGRVWAAGDTNEVVDRYLQRQLLTNSPDQAAETDSFLVHSVGIRSTSAAVLKTFDTVEVHVEFTPKVDIIDFNMYVGFLTLDNTRLAGLDLKDFTTFRKILAGERIGLGFRLESFPFLHGQYQLELHLKDMGTHLIEQVPSLYKFDVVETAVYNGRKVDAWFGHVGLRAEPITN